MHSQAAYNLPGRSRIQETIIDGQSKGKTLYVDSEHIEKCADIWARGEFTTLGLSSYQDAFSSRDVSCLKLFSSVRKLHVHLTYKLNLSGLSETLPCLEAFFANDEMNGIQDFRLFTGLKELGQAWENKLIFPAEMLNLERLSFTNFKPKDNCLLGLPFAPRLQVLSLARTTIQTLSGIERYNQLQSLSILSAPALVDISHLQTMKQIESISFELCKRLEGVESVLKAMNLTTLNITGCSLLHSISFVRTLPRIEKFVFMDTDVVDGDMTPLMGHTSLKHVAFTRKRHFSHSEKQVLKSLAGTNNGS